jgi:hypothetical protein
MRNPLPSPDRFVVDEQGKKESVIIPLQQYERLLEDLHDLAAVAERRSEEPVSWEEVKERRSMPEPEKSPCTTSGTGGTSTGASEATLLLP